MNFATIHAVMHELVLGTMTPEDAANRLYGNGASSAAARLGIYRASYVQKVNDFATNLFPITKKVTVARFGECAWSAVLHAVGPEHRMPVERFDTSSLAAVITGSCGRDLGLPAWLGEVAELEMTERRIHLAPDVAQSQQLALAAVHAFRDFRYNVLAVTAAEDPTIVVPDERPNIIGIWRAADGIRHSRRLTTDAFRVVRAAYRAGRDGLSAMLDAASGEERAKLETAALHLVEIGLLRTGDGPATPWAPR